MVTINSLEVRVIDKILVVSGNATTLGKILLVGCKRMTSNVNIAIIPKIIVAVSIVTNFLKNCKFAGSGTSTGTLV